MLFVLTSTLPILCVKLIRKQFLLEKIIGKTKPDSQLPSEIANVFYSWK